MTDNLIPALFISFASAVLYLFIGWRLGEKTFRQEDDAKAWRAFRVWWFGMALTTGLQGLGSLLFAAGLTSLALHIPLVLIRSLTAAAALWGLLTYLIYIFTGRRGAALWLGIFYSAFALLLIYSIYALQPGAITFSGWGTELTYQNVPSQAFGLIFAIALLLLISLPPVIAAIGFFTLFFRVKERSSKYRALLVPIGIFMLFGLSYLVPLALYPFGVRLNEISWWPLTIRLISLVGLALIYWAYFPPTLIQKRLRVSPVTS
jgi:hypothetical protein